jgi:ATP-dependent DNA helicase RecQ
MDDNMRFPKHKKEVGAQLKSLIKIISETKEKYKSKEIVRTLVGKKMHLFYLIKLMRSLFLV